jgi:hypothetical protein
MRGVLEAGRAATWEMCHGLLHRHHRLPEHVTVELPHRVGASDQGQSQRLGPSNGGAAASVVGVGSKPGTSEAEGEQWRHRWLGVVSSNSWGL